MAIKGLIPPTVYSNLTQEIDTEVEERARHKGTIVMHAAYDFCGYLQYDPVKCLWTETVWVHRKVVGVYQDACLSDLLRTVCSEYGVE